MTHALAILCPSVKPVETCENPEQQWERYWRQLQSNTQCVKQPRVQAVLDGTLDYHEILEHGARSQETGEEAERG